MASEQQVKRYLAYWFQLGKKIIVDNGNDALLPQPVIVGDRYSQSFENVWQQVCSPESGDCHLEGTEQTIEELLSSQWDMEACSRCDMPVPVYNCGVAEVPCPCFDLSAWPNLELPPPRAPISTQQQLAQIRNRLHKHPSSDE